jgi:type IV pilus assembly protein PilM
MIFSKIFSSKRFLGIDIGTSGIKMVELSDRGERKKLENYAEMKTKVGQKNQFRTFEKDTLLLSSKDVAQAIKATMREARFKTRDCTFSIPDFSTFFTTLELPPMTKAELSQAVIFEAKQHVPLSLEEVTLDWGVIGSQDVKQAKEKLEIILVAVPNEVVNQYREIARLANLQPQAMEAEVFSLIRSLIPTEEKETVAIIDIGAQTTTCSIIDKGVLRLSHSFDFSGNDLTKRVAEELYMDYPTAENLKEKYGLEEIPLSPTNIANLPSAKGIKKILISSVDVVLKETERVTFHFHQTTDKNIQKFIIAGGVALMPGLRKHFENYLKEETEIADPFSKVFRPMILEETLREMGPRYAIAVGAALRGMEET